MLRPAYAPELSLEADALRLICKWKGFPKYISTSVNYGGHRCTITIEPAGESIPLIDQNALTDCQEDVLAILRAVAPKRLTRPKVSLALDDAGKIHSESTISLALTMLAKRGMISRPRKGSRDGYGISEKAGNLPKT